MTYIKYPKITIPDVLGAPIQCAFTDGGHVSVTTDAHHNDDRPTVTYRGTEYLIHFHLYRASDWTEDNGDPDNYLHTPTVRGTYRPAARTVRAALVDAVRMAVIEYVEAHPETLRAAEYANANNEADSAAEEVEKLAAQLKAARATLKRHRKRMADNAPE